MFDDSAPEPRTGFRIYILLSAVAFLFVGLYVGWVFYSRRQANQAILEKAAEKQRSQDQQTFEMMGGNRFDILEYSASPATIQPGAMSLYAPKGTYRRLPSGLRFNPPR